MSNQAKPSASPGNPDQTPAGAQADAVGPTSGERPVSATESAAPSGSAPDSPAPNDRPSLEQLLADAQTRIEEQREAVLRALADAENARKRAQSEILNAQKFALERFVEALLPVADSLDAALATESATVDALRSGVEVTQRQLRAVFEKERVTEVAPAVGERFDPHRHQAMAAVESDAEPNTVVSLLQKGWCLHDRVLRPALVTVAKARSANDA